MGHQKFNQWLKYAVDHPRSHHHEPGLQLSALYKKCTSNEARREFIGRWLKNGGAKSDSKAMLTQELHQQCMNTTQMRRGYVTPDTVATLHNLQRANYDAAADFVSGYEKQCLSLQPKEEDSLTDLQKKMESITELVAKVNHNIPGLASSSSKGKKGRASAHAEDDGKAMSSAEVGDGGEAALGLASAVEEAMAEAVADPSLLEVKKELGENPAKKTQLPPWPKDVSNVVDLLESE